MDFLVKAHYNIFFPDFLRENACVKRIDRKYNQFEVRKRIDFTQ